MLGVIEKLSYIEELKMRRKELGFSQTCEYKSNCSTWKCTGYARADRQDVYQIICKDTRF